MSLNANEIFLSSVGFFVLLLSFIQISPIKINPWTCIAKAIGKAVNSDLLDKIDTVEDGIIALKDEIELVKHDQSMARAEDARGRILRFGDEIRLGTKHSQDHFEQILRDIDMYEFYCENNPDFENNVTESTCKIISECFYERLKRNDFL